MRLLVTGGPVFARLDPVKIITNRFRGGLMAKLAVELLLHGHEVTYLTMRGSELPNVQAPTRVIFHDGIEGYREQVLRLAPGFDGVVLGAAVANLIPRHPFKTKFPSHDYKPGDVIPIEFTIAPRIIDEVKQVAPRAKLFGFKLLTDVGDDELVTAAYGTLLGSRATAVVANDTNDLQRKLIVTRERGVIETDLEGAGAFIHAAVGDEYYRTILSAEVGDTDGLTGAQVECFNQLVKRYAGSFKQTPEGYVFGTIAVVDNRGGFLTTGRGKNELDDRVYVMGVDHEARTVYAYGKRKATLNAPLLDVIFKRTRCYAIVHVHEQVPGAPTLRYAPSGTVRDVNRPEVGNMPVFNVEGHGSYRVITA